MINELAESLLHSCRPTSILRSVPLQTLRCLLCVPVVLSEVAGIDGRTYLAPAVAHAVAFQLVADQNRLKFTSKKEEEERELKSAGVALILRQNKHSGYHIAAAARFRVRQQGCPHAHTAPRANPQHCKSFPVLGRWPRCLMIIYRKVCYDKYLRQIRT